MKMARLTNASASDPKTKQATHSLETEQSAVSKIWFLWSRYLKFKLTNKTSHPLFGNRAPTKQATHSLETEQSAVSKIWFLWSRYLKFKLVDVDLKTSNCSKKVHLAGETNF
jgi:predicted secreted protein